MHVLSLDVSRRLKEGHIHMLCDDRKTTNAMRKSNGDPKPLNQIKINVLSGLDKILGLVAKQFLGFGLQVEISKADRIHNLSGLLGERSLIGTLKASNFERINQVSSFLEAIFDFFCENQKKKALVTKVITLYSDLNNTLMRELTPPCCTEEELSKAAKMI